jgi:heat shock protein HslJ
MKNLIFLVMILGLTACGSKKSGEAEGATPETMQAPTTISVDEQFGGKTWVLTAYGESDNLMSVPAGVEVTLEMDLKEDRVAGVSGCNNYFGSLKTSDEGYRISGLGGTRKMCSEEAVMQMEAMYLDMIGKVTGYGISNDLLTMEVEGSRQLVFASR